MKKIFILPVLALLLFSACEKEAKIDVPVTPPMMAVFAFVEDGSPLNIKLEEVVPIFAQPKRSPGPVSGATVIVREGSQTYLFVEDVNTFEYKHPTFVGQAGKSYELEVTHPAFPALKASCSVPVYTPAAVKMQYISTPENIPGFSDSSRRIGFRWADEPGRENFYRLGAEVSIDGAPVMVQFSDKNSNDKKEDGAEIFSGLAPFYHYTGGAPISGMKARLDLMALDEHAARYMITFDASRFGMDNPFGEPVIMYTNIKGGLGIFGGVKRAYFEMDVY